MATMTAINDTEFEFVERVRIKLQMWLALSRVIEETLADLVAAYTPLIAPLIPAAIGFENVRVGLGFGLLLALIYAIIVEFLGLATTTTVLQFRAWNRQLAAGASKAPIGLAIAMAAFYLVVVLVVNVALDTGTGLQKFVKAAASLFSIIGAVTMALRNEQAKRVAELAAERLAQETQAEQERQDAERMRVEAEEREYQRRVADEERERQHQLKLEQQRAADARKMLKLEAETHRRDAGVTPDEHREIEAASGNIRRWEQVPQEDYAWISGASPADIVQKYKLDGKDPERKARSWRELAQKRAQALVQEV